MYIINFRMFLKLIIIILFAVSTFAQGDYLKRGESALEFGVFTPVIGEEQKPGGSAGLSIKGIVDFGLSFQKMNIRKTLFTKSMTVHLLRQGTWNVPFGLSFRAGTASYNIGNLFSENSYSYGTILYRNIPIGDAFTVQPSVGLSLLKDNSLDKNSDNRRGFVYDLGLSSYWKVNSGNAVNVSLKYSLYNSDWIGESGDNDELKVQATFIMQNFGGKKIGFRERRELKPKGIRGEAGLGLIFLTAGGVTGIGISGIVRGSQVGEANFSIVSFNGGVIGFSGDIALIAIKGGTENGRPGICLLAGASSVRGYSSYSVGMGLYGDFYASEKTMIQPMIGIAYAGGTGLGNNNLGFQFSLTLLNEIKPGRKARFDVGFSAVDVGSGSSHNYVGTFGLSIGVMFGKTSDYHENSKEKK